MALNPKRRVDILGVHVNTLDLPTAVNEIDRWIQDGDRHYVCVRDAHGVMLAQKDEKFRQIQNNSGLTTPDGMPMVWCGRWAGEKEMSRVYGPDLIQAVTERASEKQWKFFYYGGTEGVAEELAAEIKRRAPGVQNVGTFCPPFRPLDGLERAEVIKLINEADPDIVWVGLSSPKQEFWMDDVRSELNAAALIGIGAAYDMLTGRVRQAPRFIQRSGFEWLFRLVMEPRRLWRRYVLNLPAFAFKLARNKPTLIDPE
ncbi:MAG: WecB/TagA/CpsF family glycosyltransferase [Acidimicrobiales bacterium]|nr:WecB/TagA/CpsF family glycosyltransferase [Acidimicrobiales bacterium]